MDKQLIDCTTVSRVQECVGLSSNVGIVTTVCPAHLIGKVLVLAPNPLSGPSPGRLAGSMFALDSPVEAGPSLGLLVAVGGGPLRFSTYQPQLYLTINFVFKPGGSDGWENYCSSSGAHQYVDVSIITTSAF